MNAELIRIGGLINECFAHIKATISLEELTEFQNYITEQDALMPLLQTTAYNNGGAVALNFVRQRATSLKNLLEEEEKLLKEANPQK